MQLILLYISITAQKMIAYSPTETLVNDDPDRLGKTRFVRFRNNGTTKTQPATSDWLFTDYPDTDFQTLCDSGWDKVYVDVNTGAKYKVSTIEQLKSQRDDITFINTSPSKSVDNFAS